MTPKHETNIANHFFGMVFNCVNINRISHTNMSHLSSIQTDNAITLGYILLLTDFQVLHGCLCVFCVRFFCFYSLK
jgi:hypothetical protein